MRDTGQKSQREADRKVKPFSGETKTPLKARNTWTLSVYQLEDTDTRYQAAIRDW